jgi:hypothetical protein
VQPFVVLYNKGRYSSYKTKNDQVLYTTKVGKTIGSCGETRGKCIPAESNDGPAGGANTGVKMLLFPVSISNLNFDGEACTCQCDAVRVDGMFCPG